MILKECASENVLAFLKVHACLTFNFVTKLLFSVFYYFWTENISEYCRKDKSLGVLSQKFLMMFLVSEVKSSSHRGYYMATQRYEICLFFQHAKRNFASPSGHVMFYLLYKHQ